MLPSSNWLGHRPFTAKITGSSPVGSAIINFKRKYKIMKKLKSKEEFEMLKSAKKFQRTISEQISLESKIKEGIYIAPKHRIKRIDQVIE